MLVFKENIRQTIHTNHYRTIHATMFEKNNLCTVLPDLFAGLVPSSGACCWCCCCCRCCRCCSRNAAMPPMFTLFFFVDHGGSMTAKCLSVCRAGTVLPQHSDTPFYTTATNSRRCEKKNGAQATLLLAARFHLPSLLARQGYLIRLLGITVRRVRICLRKLFCIVRFAV